jgi:PI-3-kinase-related kinase SMG-1
MLFRRAANAVAASGGGGGTDGISTDGAVPALRQYSVTPLGPRAGLVQWVRNTLSLFALYRSWQSAAAARAAAVAAARRAAEGGGDGAGGEEEAPPLPLMVAAARPADAFYARLLPALRAAGVPRNAPRKDWPAGGGS